MRVKRLEKGMDQRQLAEMLGVSRYYVQQWEMDRQVPSDDEWQALATLLALDANLKSANPTAE